MGSLASFNSTIFISGCCRRWIGIHWDTNWYDLGHESRGQAMGMGDVVNAVFVDLGLVGFGYQRIETRADLPLPGGTHLMVMYLYRKAHILHRQTHTRAHILE